MVVEVAADKQASDILMLDIRPVSTLADFFVLLNAESERQMEALCEELAETVTRDGGSLYHREGTANSGWMILDFGDVVVHVFSPEVREYYQLEQVWAQAPTVLRIQ